EIKSSDDKMETNLKKLIFFSVLTLTSGIFLCFGVGPYRPDHMAKVILALIMLVSALGVGKEIMHHIRHRKSHGLDENNYDEIFSDYEKKSDNGTDDWNKPEDIEMEYKEKTTNAEDGQGEESVIYGRTVLLSESRKMAENVLMEKRRGKEIVHQLDEFPYVIGKVKDSVNLVLNDVSVSRIHAKLTEENGQIYVQDCHSTNGTYVNGVLLEKEERIPIEADDEIRIGRITLLYQ
ncbi:MAG: FHA domain-containing protein, partial [Lachnospiraceae bacterium]|nr:FHA domain-containing protein [Lachnospiraceae bacterium]